MAPDEPRRSSVEIRQSIEEARQQLQETPECELMATYVLLGELLESVRTDEEYVQECRALVDRLIVLGKAQEREWQQRWAAWLARNTTMGGEAW